MVLLGVNLYVQSQGAQGKIQQELSRSLGVPLKIRSMSVTPWGGLELSGITIPQTVSVGPKHFLEARTFRLRVRFLSLFSRRLVIKEVSLVGPRVVWPQNTEGKWRLPDTQAAHANRQDIESRNYNAAGSVTSRYDDSATTPLVGVVVKPWENVSLYYNYVEGLSKGDIAPATAANAGETFAPYETKQHELGVKVEHGTFISTLALFQIEKPSGELGAGNVFSVQAEQRNRGIELSMFGEVATGTRLMGGVTFLDGELTDSAIAANVGNKPVGVPDVQANLWAEWDTPWIQGFTLNGGAIYTDSQYVNQANTQELPSWTRFDVGARYTTKIEGRPTTFRATVQNVADREYWSGVASYGAFSPGYPRALQLSATVDF